MSDDTPTERFDPTGGSGTPLPKFPWEEGYVAPGTPPAAPPTPPANADVPTELFNAQPTQPPQPISPFNPIVIPPAAAPPVTDDATKKFDALPSDDPFGPGGMFAAEAFHEHPDALVPTERFAPADVPAPSAPYPSRRAATPPPKNNRALLWVLGSIATLLVIAIVVLLVVLFQPEQAPVALPTDTPPAPSATAVDPEPSTTPEEPEIVGPTFDSFEAPTSSGCEEGDTEKQLSFSWASKNAIRAYIGVATDNARDAPYDGDLPPEFTYTDI